MLYVYSILYELLIKKIRRVSNDVADLFGSLLLGIIVHQKLAYFFHLYSVIIIFGKSSPNSVPGRYARVLWHSFSTRAYAQFWRTSHLVQNKLKLSVSNVFFYFISAMQNKRYVFG